MSIEENKAVVRRWTEARNANDLGAALALWADDQRESLRGAFAAVSAAFPDVRITPEDLIAEGDRVALRWTFRGTHRGPFQGIPATGKAVSWTGIDVYTVVGGKIASLVREADTLGLLQQLGAIPAPGQVGA